MHTKAMLFLSLHELLYGILRRLEEDLRSGVRDGTKPSPVLLATG